MSEKTLETWQESNEQLEKVKEQVEEMSVELTDHDSPEELWDDLLDGEEVTLELDVMQVLDILGRYEQEFSQPGGPLDRLMALEIFLDIIEQQEEVLADIIEQEYGTEDDADGPGRMFQ